MPTARASDELGPSFGRVLAGALATVLVVGELSIGGVWDLLRIPYARETVTRLGYPTYVLVILGACKLPAAVVLMVPGLRVLKEWAYAGAFVSYIVTASSHFAVGDDLGAAFAPSVFAALVLVSKMLRAPVPGATARPTVRGERPLAYWLTTTILAVACLFGGILWTLHAQPFIRIMLRLGYPEYFMSILGPAYLAAGVVLVVPRTPQLKEWAYAGLVFNYVGAVASHLAVGDSVASVLVPCVLLVLALVSWALRPTARRSDGQGFGIGGSQPSEGAGAPA
ncbi:MAG TPA: DoxX family protein [Polyangiaceae bacterium]|nr:DoxX family protein [Polyangiaceae bacterium]